MHGCWISPAGIQSNSTSAETLLFAAVPTISTIAAVPTVITAIIVIVVTEIGVSRTIGMRGRPRIYVRFGEGEVKRIGRPLEKGRIGEVRMRGQRARRMETIFL